MIMSEKFEHTNGIIKSRKSKDRQYNSHTEMDKRTNNALKHYTEHLRLNNMKHEPHSNEK